MTHYEGFLQKLIGFTGAKVSTELAHNLLDLASKFCEVYDPTLSKSKESSADPKYKFYLPFARWVKLASEIAIKQATLSTTSEELKKYNTRNSKIGGELNELNEMIGEWDKEIEKIEESLKDLQKFIAEVFYSL